MSFGLEFGIPFIIFILALSIRGNWRFEAVGSLALAVQEKEGRKENKNLVLTRKFCPR